MKPVVIITLIIASFLMLLMIVGCLAVATGIHNGECQNQPAYTSGC